MPLMIPKRQAIGAIMTKLRGSVASTSEHSSDALKASNEAASGADVPQNEFGDEINVTTAVDAAAQSCIQALEAKNPDAFKGAIFDLFDLYKLSQEGESENKYEPEDED